MRGTLPSILLLLALTLAACGGGNAGQGQVGLPGGSGGPSGDGSAGDGGTTEQPASTPHILSISAHENVTCVIVQISDARRLKCWGDNRYGQLGLGISDGIIGDDELPSSQAYVDIDPTVSRVAVGSTHVCAIVGAGAVRCWGANQFGQLGMGNTATVPLLNSAALAGNVDLGPSGAGGGATAISAGNAHTCAILDGFTVRCWGLNDHGQLGLGNTDNLGDDELPSSVPFVAVGDAGSIGSGDFHTCVQVLAAGVRCWGLNVDGNLGYGSRTDDIGDNEAPNSLPSYLLTEANIGPSGLVGGFAHTCGQAGGDVRCWGSGTNGAIGTGNRNNVTVPSALPLFTIMSDYTAVSQVAAGSFHTCALTLNGDVYCWGRGDRGELGYPGVTYVGADDSAMGHGPVDIGGKATMIAAGIHHTCAVMDTGGVRCWGDNTGGQLGLGVPTYIGDDEVPASIPEVSLF